MEQSFKEWVAALSKKYRQSQIKAAIKVNSELLFFYLELGEEISKTSFKAAFGSKFYETLSKELTSKIDNSKGFSPRNLRYIESFYTLYNREIIKLPQVVAQLTSIPWAHHRYIIDKCKDSKKALFFVRKTIENNWSRAVLLNFLDTNLYEREGKAITNFSVTLPETNGDLANESIKNPYNFNFLTLTEKYNEKELKDALINNIQKFLTELGTGFAYMGREYRLEVGQTEQFLDMLFYNTKIHAYVVIEVKTTSYKPEYSGQLGTYVVAVDHLLKTDRDEKTIGILICKDKDETLVRYSLESSSQPLGVSSYELSKLIPENFRSSLPTIEEMEEELKDK